MSEQDFAEQSLHDFLANTPETSLDGLTLNATLAELPLHKVAMNLKHTANDIKQAFENPALPGIIICETDADGDNRRYSTMISRRRFLEVMNQPYSKELFSRRPLQKLLGFIRGVDSQIWPSSASVVEAASQCLQRPLEIREEPLVVQCGEADYRILDLNVLLVSHAKIHELATRMLEHQFKVQKYAVSLEARNEELQRINRMKDEFLANTSHELRTPLNGIIGIAASLLEGSLGELNAEQQSNLALILNSGRRLTNLVNDILDSSKLRHKTLELQLRPLNLKHAADNVIQLSESLLGQKPLQLINQVPADLPLAWADENRIQQIMHNLVGNALKFTHQGSVTISAKHTQTQDSEHLVISVSDTGIGIPADKQASVFEAFEQGDGSTARQYGGTGLGLSITRQLVELHGGHIYLSSQPGEGSTFSFSVPVAADQSAATSEDAAAQNHEFHLVTPNNGADLRFHMKMPDNAATAAFKVLIVDDEAVNHQVLHNQLAPHKEYALYHAMSGTDAIFMLEETVQPDIIILDVMMPEMSGYEVTRVLRKVHHADSLPILLLTAKNQVNDVVTGLEAGANDYLTKPVAKEELLARLKTHLNLKSLKADNARMAAELDISRQIQQMLLPPLHELEHPELELAGFMLPADEVGGDYYDILHFSNENATGGLKVGIGDVTGHGLESGVMAIMVQSAIRTLLANNETDPVKFLNSLNHMIYHNAKRMNCGKTLTLSILDYNSGKIRLSGQHEEVIIIRASGYVERIDTINLGFFIGMQESIERFVSDVCVDLDVGDAVILYTDGITEAMDMNGEQYGVERLCEVLKFNRQRSALDMRQAVIEDVEVHTNGGKILDDLTLVIIKQKNQPTKQKPTLLPCSQNIPMPQIAGHC